VGAGKKREEEARNPVITIERMSCAERGEEFPRERTSLERVIDGNGERWSARREDREGRHYLNVREL